MCPFFRKYAAAIRSEIPEAIMFCEPVINFEDLHGDPPPSWIDDKDVGYVFFFSNSHSNLLNKFEIHTRTTDQDTSGPNITMMA